MNWYKISSWKDTFSGNCGMYAIAFGKIAQEQNKNVVIVIVWEGEENENINDIDEPKIYHIAVEIDGEIYDGRGKTNLNDIGNFAYKIYGDPKPKAEFIALDDTTIRFISQNTNWNVSWQQYYKMMKKDSNMQNKLDPLILPNDDKDEQGNNINKNSQSKRFKHNMFNRYIKIENMLLN